MPWNPKHVYQCPPQKKTDVLQNPHKIFIKVSNFYLQGASKGLTTIQEFTSQEFGSVNITRFGVLGGSKVCIWVCLFVCLFFREYVKALAINMVGNLTFSVTIFKTTVFSQ